MSGQLRRPLVLAAALLLLVASACTGSSEATATPSPSPTATENATVSPIATNTPLASTTATQTPTPGTTEEQPATAEELNALPSNARLGEPAFDAIVDVVVSGDVEAVIEAITWEERECAVKWSGGPPSPPPYLEGEPDGTFMQSITVGGNETSHQRPEQVRELLQRVFSEDRELCELLSTGDGARVVVLRQALLWTVVERGTTTEAALVEGFSASVVDGAVVMLGDSGEALLQSQIKCRGVADIP